MERIDPIKRRDGVEPIRLAVLTPLEREQERQERERRRRARDGGAGKPAADDGVASRPTVAPAPRLDLRA